MPTLDEMRRWMSGEDVDGLPAREGRWKTERKVEVIEVQQEAEMPEEVEHALAEEKNCRTCQGVGQDVFGESCKDCNGTGRATYERKIQRCSNCYGTGSESFTEETCEICKGSGQVEFDVRKDKSDLAKRISQRKTSGGKYKISARGDDAMLKFGKHNGKWLSEIAKENKGYLEWILEQKFPDDLKDVCRYLIRTTR